MRLFLAPQARVLSHSWLHTRVHPGVQLSRSFSLARPLWAQIKENNDHGHSHAAGSHSHSHGDSDLHPELSDHDHVHLRESETETNDSFTFGEVFHDHNHSHGPNRLLVLDRKAFWENPGVRITWIGLLINVGMAAGKFAGGVVFHSQALMADSVHAISDLVSDLLTLTTVGLSARGPTSDFPYGYGKVETVGSLAVSSILTMAGVSIGWASLVNIVGPVIPHTVIDTLNAYHIHLLSAGHAHSHGHVHGVTDINAAWIAGASIVAKEWIFRATSKVAKQTNSKVLLANAWHHRVDSLTSLVALVTISSGYLFGITSLDAIGGLIVSGLVVKAGFKGMVTACSELVDRSIPKNDPRYIDVENKLQDLLSKMLSNNNSKKPYAVKELILLTSGPNVQAKVVLEAPLQRWDNILGINEFEIVSHHLKKQLMAEVDNLRQVVIEFVGEKEPEPAEEEQVEEEVKEEPAHTHTHNGGSVHNHKH